MRSTGLEHVTDVLTSDPFRGRVDTGRRGEPAGTAGVWLGVKANRHDRPSKRSARAPSGGRIIVSDLRGPEDPLGASTHLQIATGIVTTSARRKNSSSR